MFKIDPILRPEYQSIQILAAIPREFRNVMLVVNDKERLVMNERGTWWTLKKGTQKLQLEARDRNRLVVSKPITINVE